MVRTTNAAGNQPTPWVKSGAKKLLKKDIVEGRVTIDMAPRDVYGMRDEFMEYELKNFTTNLKNLHAAIENKKDRAVAAWVSSRAKKLLKKDIVEGRVTIDMEAQYVYGTRDEFMEYELKNFTTNLRNLHAAIEKEQDRAVVDSDAYAHDILIHPLILQGPSGYPQWQGSEAARLLKIDIEEEKHKSMKPSDLRNTQEEYKRFPLKVFRKHIDQEVRSRKDSLYWLIKRNKKKDQDDI
jgi:hypothetical protein